MLPDASSITVTATIRRPAWRTICRALPLYLELGKARLSVMVVITAGVGYLLAQRGPLDWPRLAATLLGTLFAALGANALNEWREIERDARMQRTAGRPLPTRRLEQPAALAFGVLAGTAGAAILALCTNLLAAALALATLLIYVLLYTPLKVRTPANTLLGGVVGALPPLLGWAAASGRLAAGAWVLASVLFLWQVPHFLALAWLYRDDYARGGFCMLPAVDPTGRLTGYLVVIYTLVLLPVTLMLTALAVTGWVYAAGAIALGLGLAAIGVSLERQRTAAAARRLFLASIIYLPLLMGLMVADRVDLGGSP